MSTTSSLHMPTSPGAAGATLYVAQPVVETPTRATPVQAAPVLTAAPAAPLLTAQPADPSICRSPWYGLVMAAFWHARLMLTASFISGAINGAAVVVMAFIELPAHHQDLDASSLQVSLNEKERPRPKPPTPMIVKRPQSPELFTTDSVAATAGGSGSAGSGGGSGGGNRGGIQSMAVNPPTIARSAAGGTGFGIDRAFGRDMLGEIGQKVEGSATFFGVKATGSTFAFVVDTSGSMSENNRFVRCRSELFRSLSALKYGQKYFVVYFNDTTFPMPEHKLVEARPGPVRKTMEWAMGAVPAGSTDPWDGLVMSMRLKPDAIYLLTDGQFSPGVIERIEAFQSKAKKIPIHTIAFESQIGEQLLLTISKMTGGKYTYVP